MEEFLTAVLGPSGFTALKKAVGLSGEAESAILARTLLGWLELQGRFGYQSFLPGTQHCLVLQKSDQGYSGSLALPQQTVQFNQDSLEKVAAWVAVGLGVTQPLGAKKLKHLPQLGQSIDLLVKAQFLGINLKKTLPHQPKQALPKPKLPKPKTVSLPKPSVRLQAFKLEKSHFLTNCLECGQPLFKSKGFVGCFCLGNSAVVKERNGHSYLEQKGDLDEWEAILATLKPRTP